MHRAGALSTVLVLLALALPASSNAGAPNTAPDCRFENARAYEDFGRIRVFTADSKLYGCLTDVGRAHRLSTGTLRARSSAARRTVFGVGDWVAFTSRTRSGVIRARATNLRTGATHGASAPDAVTALVVNFDGTLAWISGTRLRTKPADGRTSTLGSDNAIDRHFLGLEKDQGCAVTWKVGGTQRSSSIHCGHP